MDLHAKNRSLARALIAFSVPLILSGLLQQLYSWADAFIVGNIEGEAALAAIGSTSVVIHLLIAALTGFTSGVSILSARFFGMGDGGAQRKILSTFIGVLFCAFLLLTVVCVCFADGMLRLLRTPDDIFVTATRYLQIVLLGIPFLTIYNVYAAVLRGIGDSKAPFYSVLISSAVNIVLDILFVGVFHWHAEGAAWATVLSQAIMTVFLALYAARSYETLRIRSFRRSFDPAVFRRGAALAMPITVQSVVASAGNLVLQNFMNGFGTATVAAITTAYRIDSVIMLPVFNLGTGISTMTSQNIGAKDSLNARKCLRVGIWLTALVSFVLTVLVILTGENLIRIFGVTEEAVRIGKGFFYAIACFYVPFGISMAIRGYVEGCGRVVFSGVCGILSLLVRIVLSYALRPVFGNMVIAWAEGFSWCFQLILFAAYAFFRRKALARG